MRQEIVTSNTNSLESNFHKVNTDAPNTFLTPISLVLCSATNEASPYNPRHEMKIASTAKMVVRLPILSSSENFFPYSWSTNLYSKGLAGLYFLKTDSILARASCMFMSGLIFTQTRRDQVGCR